MALSLKAEQALEALLAQIKERANRNRPPEDLVPEVLLIAEADHLAALLDLQQRVESAAVRALSDIDDQLRVSSAIRAEPLERRK